MLNLTIDEKKETCLEGTTYLELAKRYQKGYEHDILLAVHNGYLKELNQTVESDGTVAFLTAADKAGLDTYHRSVLFLFLKAIYHTAEQLNREISNVKVLFSVRKGLLIDVEGAEKVDDDFLNQVKQYMKELVEENLPIAKRSVHTREAIRIFESHDMPDKVELFRFRRASSVNIYRLEDFEDYFYGYMVPSTEYLKYFDLCMYEQYVILQLPEKDEPEIIPPFLPQPKVYSALLRSVEWRKMMEVNTVGDLNQVISKGDITELMLVQEALQEKRLADIAQEIANRPEVKFIMIAGPSSSGKTTTSRRLGIQLKAHGLKPHSISVDNYFVEREKTPKDAKGDYDYECLEALDLELFNQNMCDLLEGKEVDLPVYNFVSGTREYNGTPIRMGKEDILVIEGIHALNDAMSYKLPRESKFRIYLSALTQLNIDEHNRIPTTDGRLIRRMVRDARTRGTSAQSTIKRWQSVRFGEENNIFPHQEDADVVFDSSLIYELAALKPWAEPLLFQIPEDSPEAAEARRLLKFFDYFLSVDSGSIPNNSILREFVGGSCFDV